MPSTQERQPLMRPEIRDKWVAALRGGQYQQSKRYLKSLRGYCCLGVLCDLYLKEFPDKAFWTDDHEFIVDGRKNAYLLPHPVREWSGLSTRNGVFPVAIRAYNSLDALNDYGASFDEIAKIIEENF